MTIMKLLIVFISLLCGLLLFSKPLGSLLRQKLTQKVVGYLLKLFIFLVIYFLISFFAIGIFSFAYKGKMAQLNMTPLSYSLLAYIGKLTLSFDKEHFWEIFELFMNTFISICFIATTARRIVTPGNPIELSSCVCIKKSNGGLKLVIRFWLMKPGGEFMYDVQTRAYLQPPANVRDPYLEEVHCLKSWQGKYDMLRGINQWVIDLKDTRGVRNVKIKGFPKNKQDYIFPVLMYNSMKQEELEMNQLLYTPKGKNGRFKRALARRYVDNKIRDAQYNLIVVIRATDDRGHRYSAVKSYDPRRVFYGAEFAEVRGSVIETLKLQISTIKFSFKTWFYKKLLNAKMVRNGRKHEEMRYQNFNKVVMKKKIKIPKQCRRYIDNLTEYDTSFTNDYQMQENRAARLIWTNQLTKDDPVWVRCFNAIAKSVYNKDKWKNIIKDKAENRRYDLK